MKRHHRPLRANTPPYPARRHAGVGRDQRATAQSPRMLASARCRRHRAAPTGDPAALGQRHRSAWYVAGSSRIGGETTWRSLNQAVAARRRTSVRWRAPGSHMISREPCDAACFEGDLRTNHESMPANHRVVRKYSPSRLAFVSRKVHGRRLVRSRTRLRGRPTSQAVARRAQAQGGCLASASGIA